MAFAPSSTDGGVINIGNSVGVGNANFGGESSATGPSTGLNLGLNLGTPTQPTLMLVNLVNIIGPMDLRGKKGSMTFDGRKEPHILESVKWNDAKGNNYELKGVENKGIMKFDYAI